MIYTSPDIDRKRIRGKAVKVERRLKGFLAIAHIYTFSDLWTVKSLCKSFLSFHEDLFNFHLS